MRESGGSSKKNEPSTGVTRSSSQGPRSIGDHARRIRQDSTTLASDVSALASEVSDTTSSVLEKTILDQMKNQPLRTLGVAAGIGYLLGGGGPFRLTGFVVGTATRVAAGMALLKEIGEVGQELQSSVQRLKAPENGLDLLKEIGQFGRQLQSTVSRFNAKENPARP